MNLTFFILELLGNHNPDQHKKVHEDEWMTELTFGDSPHFTFSTTHSTCLQWKYEILSLPSHGLSMFSNHFCIFIWTVIYYMPKSVWTPDHNIHMWAFHNNAHGFGMINNQVSTYFWPYMYFQKCCLCRCDFVFCLCLLKGVKTTFSKISVNLWMGPYRDKQL